MTVNCVNIAREEESLNIANINLLVRFNKTREIFASVTRVLTILLTTTSTSASVEWILKSVYQRFRIQFCLPAMRRDELFAAITQLMSECLWSGWKSQKRYKEMVSPFICCPVNLEYSWKKNQIEKNMQIMLYNM